MLDLNQVESIIEKEHRLTDEMIDFMAELDTYNSKTTKAWLIRAAKSMYSVAGRFGIDYNGQICKKDMLDKILEGRISNFILKNAKEKEK